MGDPTPSYYGQTLAQELMFQAVLTERAHFMRHHMTETEAQLWRRLAGGALGVAFKRQTPIDRYIVDFLAPAAKLVVEMDGGAHAARRSRDVRRDRALARLVYREVRIPAEVVRSDVAEAVARIVAGLQTP